MNIKSFAHGLAIALPSAIVAAVLALAGTHYMNPAQEQGKEQGKEQSKEQGREMFSGLFNFSEEHVVQFVEIKNLIITLKDSTSAERYLLLELALATGNQENASRLQEMEPAIRGATVSLLANMDYNDVRNMHINTLRDQLTAAYAERFAGLKVHAPFDDVIISKMIFQ